MFRQWQFLKKALAAFKIFHLGRIFQTFSFTLFPLSSKCYESFTFSLELVTVATTLFLFFSETLKLQHFAEISFQIRHKKYKKNLRLFCVFKSKVHVDSLGTFKNKTKMLPSFENGPFLSFFFFFFIYWIQKNLNPFNFSFFKNLYYFNHLKKSGCRIIKKKKSAAGESLISHSFLWILSSGKEFPKQKKKKKNHFLWSFLT